MALLLLGFLAVQAAEELIQLAYGLQASFDLAIGSERPANLRNLVGAQADLAVLPTGISHGENPEWMTLAAGAFGTAGRVTEHALEQRSAKDVRGGGKLRREPFTFADGPLSCHHY